MLERFAAEARRLARAKTPVLPPAILSLLGINADAGVGVLKSLGFKARMDETGLVFSQRRRKKIAPDAKPQVSPDSPFARLKELIPS